MYQCSESGSYVFWPPGSASGSVSQRYGSEDPHPDPCQHVTDPQHCKVTGTGAYLLTNKDDGSGLLTIVCVPPPGKFQGFDQLLIATNMNTHTVPKGEIGTFYVIVENNQNHSTRTGTGTSTAHFKCLLRPTGMIFKEKTVSYRTCKNFL